ncbi:hypothetical protein HH308_06355 [Gordonia sp. TBRC 11910]|uniref:Tape measure protein n=1 Tax=Gordonia asplenii TaxID=2725283 RepID=A0A848KP62_9ACTN|nr:transglycosylase family protein [Gordonia asplenii]NMO00834.1 hypothetical protein [Gordonia asplenii]
MTQPYADASVEVSLDFGDLETELRQRIERATQLAARVAQKHLEKIATVARRVTGQIAADFEAASKSIQSTMTSLEAHASKAFRAMRTAFASSMRDMVARAKGAVQSIRRELNRLDGDIAVQLVVDTEGLKTAHREAQTWLSANPLKVAMQVDSTGGLANAHRVAQTWLASNPLKVKLDVDSSQLTTLETSLTGLSDKTVKVTVNLSGASSAELRAVARALNQINQAGNPSATANVTLTGSSVADLRTASRSIKGLAKELADLQAVGNVSARVDIGGDVNQLRAASRLKGLAKELRDLQTVGHVRVQVDFDVRGGAELQALLLQLQRHRRVTIDVQSNSVGRASSSLSMLSGVFGRVGTAATMLGKYVGLAGTAVVGLAGSAPAVAALATALASVGTAAGAAGIALASAGAIGVGTLKVGLSGIGDAFKAMGKEATSSGGDAASKLKAVESAQYALTKAVREEKDAQKGVSDARKSALRTIEDLNDALGESKLSEKDAVLSLKEAQRDLATGNFDNPLEKERAQLRVEEAQQRLNKVRKDGKRTQEDADQANRKGVNGSDEVVAAQQRLADSTKAVKDARDALNDAMNPKSAGGKDPMAEALAKLSPNARAFIQAVQGIKPAWDQVKNAVQDSLFDGLAGRVSSLATQYLPTLKTAMVDVAGALNSGATEMADFMQSAQGSSIMTQWLQSSSTLAADLGHSFMDLLPGFAAIGSSATSVFSKMSGGLSDLAADWSDRMVKMQQDGRMDKVIETAIDVAKQLGAVLADVGGIIKGVFNAASAAGSGVMGTLGATLDKLNQWVNSFQGQQALTSFFQAMSQALSAILPIVTQMLGIIGGTVAPAIAGLITAIAPAVQGLVGALGEGLKALAPAMAPLGAAITSIANALVPVLPVLGQWLNALASVLGPILGALAEALGPIIVAIGQGFTQAWQALLPAVEPISQLLLALSPIITQVVVALSQGLVAAINILVPIITVLANGLTTVSPLFFGLMEMLTPLVPLIVKVGLTIYLAVKAFMAVKAIISALQIAWGLLNLAFALSPIGVIVVAVIALGAALWAFFTKTETGRQLWDKIWGGIKAAVNAVWSWMKDTVWPWLQAGFKIIGDAAMWLWQNAIQPAWQGIQTVIGVAWNIIKGYFAVWKFAFEVLAAVVVWLWHNVVEPAFQGIGALIGWVWNTLIKPIFDGWVSLWQNVLAPAVMWLWNSVLKPAFEGIGSLIGWVWDNIIKPAWDGMKTGIDVLGKAAQWLWENVFKPAWEGIKTAVSSTWDFIKPIFGYIGDGIKGLGDIAGKIGSTLKTAFDGLVNILKSPIHMLGKLLSSIPSQIKIGSWSIDIPGASKLHDWGTTLQGLKTGGRIGKARRGSDGKITGPGTMVDDLITGFVGNVPRIQVSNDEMVMTGMATRRNYKLLAAMNKGWDFRKVLPGLAGGGTVDLNKAWPNEDDRLQPGARRLGRIISQKFSINDIGGYRAPDGYNEHSTGRALDVMVGDDTAKGNEVKDFVLQNAKNIGLKWAIWQQTMWYPDGSSSPMEDRGSPTQNHMDHVHVFLDESANSGSATDPGSMAGALGISSTPGGSGGPTTAGSGTPIGSGIGGSTGSWGNSGGGSKYNSAEDAKRGGITPVWVENWPASIGGSASVAPTTTTPGDTTTPATIAPTTTSDVDTIPLKQNPDGTWTSTDPEWAKLMKRESGGKPDIVQGIQDANSGGNEASGLFQIAKGTWASHGGTKYAPTAGAATPQQQAEIAAKIFNQSGGSPWGSGAGQSGREDEAKLRAGIQRKGTTATPATIAPTTTPTPSTPTPSTTPTTPSTTTNPDLAAAQQRLSTASAAYDDADTKLKQAVASGADKSTLAKLRSEKAKALAEKQLAQKAVNATYDGTPTTTTTTTGSKVKSESMPYGAGRANQWWLEQQHSGLDIQGNLQKYGEDALQSFGDEFADMFGLKGIFDKVWAATKTGVSKDGFLIDPKTTPEQKVVQFANTVIFNGTTPTETKKQTTAGMSAITETNRSG